ncbi:MAG: IS1-like element ISMac25 family transposase [Chloroflexi bacterium OHK40]|jgi:transposase-like protein
MTSTTDLPALCPAQVVCPNPVCTASGRIGVHSHVERRYICHGCGKTFAATTGSPLYGLKHATDLVLLVLTLLAYGCPIPAIVAAFGLDERTVAAWLRKAGAQAKAVQEQVVCAGQVDLGQVQGDELYVKHQRGVVWMAMAMSVFSRLWLWGAVAPTRSQTLITTVVEQVRNAAQRGRPILWVVDGFRTWPQAILRVFRDRQPTGKRGRPPLVVWADVHIVQVVKQYAGRRVVAVQRRVAYGCQRAAEGIVQMSQVGLGVFNTAYIERLNATFRTWITALTRRARTPAREVAQIEAAMFWTGVVYNFCHVHRALSGSPAMAADLTDHVWSIYELLTFQTAPKRIHAVL